MNLTRQGLAERAASLAVQDVYISTMRQTPVRYACAKSKVKLTACLKMGLLRLLLLAPFAWSQRCVAQVPVTLRVDTALIGTNIRSDFTGLSYEMALVLPGRNGKHFFDAANKPLVQMVRTLGIKNLRVGGNTAERETVAIPGEADIDCLFGFARAAGVKVIYTLRLQGADPQADAQLAKYVLAHYKAELTCFTLGNEPDKTAKDYPAYRAEFRRFLDVITAATNAPEARFCGPSTTHMHATWPGEFARDFGHDPRVVLVTQHEYPARSGRRVTSVAKARDKLLSPSLLKAYEAFHDEFVPAVAASRLPYRLEEANSFSNGGAAGVSDTFAAALWGLDYLYWWAAHGASGINFHTGGYVAGTPPRSPMKYAVFWNAPNGFAAHPLAYALKAFDLASKGRLLPVKLSGADSLNLRAYAILAPDQTLSVVLINKEYGPDAHDAEVTLSPGNAYARGLLMLLSAPGGDVGAKTGVTLGGAAITDNGTWDGTWSSLGAPAEGGIFSVKLPAATAAILKLLP